MTDDQKRPRPHIVTREDDHAPIPTNDLERDEYTYFVYSGPEQITALKDKIKKNEEQLFDLQSALLMLDGRPSVADHIVEQIATEGTKPDPNAFNPHCPCNGCEETRTQRLYNQVEYGVRKLRALYAKISG